MTEIPPNEFPLQVDKVLEDKLVYLTECLGIKNFQDLISFLIYKEYNNELMQEQFRKNRQGFNQGSAVISPA